MFILECKRSRDRDEGFLEVKDAEANEQHKSIISALKTAAPEWEFEQMNFVVGNRRSVILMLLAFITGNSSLEPLLEGLFVQIYIDLSLRGFRRNRTGDLRITQIC